jgi:hypothetical protein
VRDHFETFPTAADLLQSRIDSSGPRKCLTTQRGPDAMALQPGTQLGPYRIDTPLPPQQPEASSRDATSCADELPLRLLGGLVSLRHRGLLLLRP